MFKSLIALVTLAGSAAAPAAAAQYLFSFVPSQALFGRPVSGNGVFTTSDTPMTVGGQTAFAILSISGMVNGSPIAAPTGNYGNYFTSGPGFLDGSGTRFFTNSGIDVRFFQQSNNGLYRVNTFGAFGSSEYVTVTSSLIPAAAVPEPAVWAMLLMGFGAVGAALRRRPTSAAARA